MLQHTFRSFTDGRVEMVLLGSGPLLSAYIALKALREGGNLNQKALCSLMG